MLLADLVDKLIEGTVKGILTHGNNYSEGTFPYTEKSCAEVDRSTPGRHNLLRTNTHGTFTRILKVSDPRAG